jgi:hypothetical protein
MKPAFNFDASKFDTIIPKVPEIDTKAAERAAILSLSQQIQQQNRAALSAVPMPRNYPGMPRF